MSTIQEIEAAALRLADEDRLRLADRLLGSLPGPAAKDADSILAEAVQRDEEIERGVGPLPVSL